ncbi:MAG: putative toxin-antitoxin system toxin component, PIN family [Thermomonas sp.]|uniref:putative toxin-antitoxin system toxin component, PIN family n=1 Tax=Thermomonas sp. TaxID=1971895 RepID=UPI0039E60E84
MPERRCVVDTNVLVSRLLMPGGTPARALDHALARGVLLLSTATLTELVDVLSRPEFDPYVSRHDREEFVRKLGGVARMVEIRWRDSACRDPRDDKFLHVAVNGEAETIITGDADLLALHPFHCVRIVTPADFLRDDG